MCHHVPSHFNWTLLHSPSLSFILLHLQHNFGTLIHFPILFHMKGGNTVTYRIVDMADSKKKVKEDFVFVPFQFTFNSHTEPSGSMSTVTLPAEQLQRPILTLLPLSQGLSSGPLAIRLRSERYGRLPELWL